MSTCPSSGAGGHARTSLIGASRSWQPESSRCVGLPRPGERSASPPARRSHWTIGRPSPPGRCRRMLPRNSGNRQLIRILIQERHMAWLGPLMCGLFTALGVFLILDSPERPWLGVICSPLFLGLTVWYPFWVRRRRVRIRELLASFRRRSHCGGDRERPMTPRWLGAALLCVASSECPHRHDHGHSDPARPRRTLSIRDPALRAQFDALPGTTPDSAVSDGLLSSQTVARA